MAEPVEIEAKDTNGRTINMIEFNGRKYPKFYNYKEVFAGLKNMKARPDDILVVSYPKSGTTWTRALVKELLRGTLDEQLQVDGFLEYTLNDELEKIESPRILFTHFTPDVVTDFFKKNCKIIFVVRNIKDTILSFYHHTRNDENYDGTFSDYLSMHLDNVVAYGSWCEHLRTWESYFEEHPEIPVLILQYEDMKEDCLREVKRMRDFLAMPRNDEFCQQVVQRCDFKNMQSRDRKDPMVKDWLNQKSEFFRKGDVGDWKNWYTVAESEQIDELYKRDIHGTKLTFQYEI